MTKALAALDAGRWNEARAALEQASQHRADAPAIADARARLEDGERRQTITATLEQAGRLEEGERWRDAERIYVEVLTIAPANAPAIEGRDRASRRADLDDALAYHANHPDRLVADSVFEEAEELLETARSIVPGGPRLDLQIEQLAAVLAVAAKPVAVVFQSDNQTEVVVYKIGRLGTFERRELSLRPGTYTVVGSRDGYRDVRLRVRVAPQNTPQSVVVRCEEAL
jgi:tetratricopeptide (TPR) repeat protein